MITLVKPAGLNSYFDLSTAHLTRTTMNLLDSGAHGFLFTVAPYDFGVFVGVPDELDLATTPKDLLQVMRYAKMLGCAVIRFDADGDTHDELPAFDWDAVQDEPEATSAEPFCQECSKFVVNMQINPQVTDSAPPADALDDPLYRAQAQGLKDMTAALNGVTSTDVVFSTDPGSVLNGDTKTCCKCGVENPVSQMLCIVCACSCWPFDSKQVVGDELVLQGWTKTPAYAPNCSIAHRLFPTVTGLRRACISIAATSESHLTLTGHYEDEGCNVLEPHAFLIPKIASEGDFRRVATNFAKRVEAIIADTPSVRLLQQPA